MQNRSFFLAANVVLAAWLGTVSRLPAAATFTVPDTELSSPPVVIVYGDTRFTDPSEHNATEPTVRKWLVAQIAIEKPDAVFVSGDIPWHGANANDYAVFAAETRVWRDNRLRIYPALGNHEFYSHNLISNEKAGLENWWTAFPALRGKRWYSVQLGSRIYALNLDSSSSLHDGSEQSRWIDEQLKALPATVRFVFFTLHHPPVADYQRFGDPSHNPRSNEVALSKQLADAANRTHAQFIVVAGHIHNYERFNQHGVTYLVSGGGGAAPRAIHRSSADLYQDEDFPNYHYVKFVLENDRMNATMFRVADPSASKPDWQAKDHFFISPHTEVDTK